MPPHLPASQQVCRQAQWLPHLPLRLIALDASTDVLSVAVGAWQAGAALTGAPLQLWQHTGPGAAQSSATLIPTVQRLLAEAQLALADLDAVVFGAGPGSFTGLRTACAVAQGLALGAGLPVLPVDTLLAVAEDWRSRHSVPLQPGQTVWSLLDARMDEIYAQPWRWQPCAHGAPQWQAQAAALLARPEQLPGLPGFGADGASVSICAGNAQPVYGARLPQAVAAAMPTADALLRLAPALLQQGMALDPALALPRYVRDKVAQTTAEREMARTAQLSTAAPNAGRAT